MTDLTRREVQQAFNTYMSKRYDTCPDIRGCSFPLPSKSKALAPGRHIVINTGVFEKEQGFVELSEDFCSQMSKPSKHFDRKTRAWFVGQYYMGQYKRFFFFNKVFTLFHRRRCSICR